jgi:hypothetical protein
MKFFTIALIATCLLIIAGCHGVAFITYNAADIQKDEYFYKSEHFDKGIEAIKRQFAAYKSRCGFLQNYPEPSFNFEYTADNEANLYVQGADGVNVVMRAKETTGTEITVWTKNKRLAEYSLNAVRGGQCRSSVWDNP